MKTLILLISLCYSSQSFSQMLFDENVSGFDFGVQFTSTKTSTLVAFIPSYTVNGKVSFGISIGSESLKDFDVNSTSIRPFFSYLAVRQSEDLPINVAPFAAYQYNTFSNLDITANTIDLGVSVNHNIEGKVELLPGAGIRWTKSTYSYLLPDYTGISYSLYLNLLFADKFYVEPFFRLQDGESTFTLFLGLLF